MLFSYVDILKETATTRETLYTLYDWISCQVCYRIKSVNKSRMVFLIDAHVEESNTTFIPLYIVNDTAILIFNECYSEITYSNYKKNARLSTFQQK